MTDATWPSTPAEVAELLALPLTRPDLAQLPPGAPVEAIPTGALWLGRAANAERAHRAALEAIGQLSR